MLPAPTGDEICELWYEFEEARTGEATIECARFNRWSNIYAVGIIGPSGGQALLLLP